MRLRTQFIITMLLFGIILVVITTSAITTNQQVKKAGQQEDLADTIAQGASELSYLANDYLIYHESQQLRRWKSKFAAFNAQIAALRADRPEQQSLVANLKVNKNRFKEVFDSAASALESPSRNLRSALDPAFLQVSWSRMAVQSQGLVADASRLSQLVHQRRDELTEKRSRLMYVMVALFGLFLIVSYMLTYRRILKSIVTLRDGTAVIGSGNLDFVLEEKKDDEIGQLSQAFNRMTSDLKKVTASKTDLEREMAERKRAEEELRRNREWLKITLRSIGDAVIATDASGRVTFLNPIAATLTGWQIKEALGQPIQSVFRIVNEQSGQPAENIAERVLREGSVVNLANHSALISRDGRKIPVEDSAAPIENSNGDIIGVVLVFHDVTEKRRDQEALRESEAKYRDLFINMAEEVHFWRLVRDEAGQIKTWRVVDVNPPALKTWGRKSLEDTIGRTADEIYPGATDHYMPVVQKIMNEGVPHSYEDYFPLPVDKYFRFTSVPLGEYFITTGADITGIKKAEEALKRAHDELEIRVLERTAELAQSNKELTIEIDERRKVEEALQESKDQLRILASQILSAQENERKRIALEVHDVLGSSLSAIKFKAEEALHHLPKEGTSDISKPLEALIPIIQDTIEEARRIQSDLRPPLLDDLGIVATLSWFCRRFETIYSSTKCEQAVTLPEEAVPDRLKIILFRIVQEAMNNIGKHAQANAVHLALRKVDGAIELRIRDNGEGFDSGSLSSRKISQKGLGLSSMKERVEFSGGSFSIESAKGKGTVIRAVWPV